MGGKQCGIPIASLLLVIGCAESAVQSDSVKAHDQRASVNHEKICPALFARARIENKPVILFFVASSSAPFQRFTNETLANAKVSSLLDQCIVRKIDIDQMPRDARVAGVAGLPDIRFANSDGTEIKRITEFLGPAAFANELRQIISKVRQ